MSKPTLDENISLLQSLIPHVKQLEARIAELEAECDQAIKERDEWQEQCEETFKTMKALEQERDELRAEFEQHDRALKNLSQLLLLKERDLDDYQAMAERLAGALQTAAGRASMGGMLPVPKYISETLAAYREWKGKA